MVLNIDFVVALKKKILVTATQEIKRELQVQDQPQQLIKILSQNKTGKRVKEYNIVQG